MARTTACALALLLLAAAAGAEDPPAPPAPAAPAAPASPLVDRFDHPPRSSASLKGLPAGKAIRLLAMQAGCPAIETEKGGTPVTLELKDVPFWEAVDRIAAAGGFRLSGSEFQAGGDSGFGTSDPLRIGVPEDGLLSAAPCNGGPVRVALVAVVLERTSKAVARFAPEAETAEPAREVLRVGLQFAPIAGLEEAEAGSLRIDTAVDEKGKAFASLEEGMSSSGTRIGGERWILFDATGGTGERLATLAGALEVILPAEEGVAEVDLATLPATAKVGGTTFTFVEVGDGTMKVTVSGSLLGTEGGDPPDLHVEDGGDEGSSGIFGPKPDSLRILLRDAAGGVVTAPSWGGGGGDVRTYDFDLTGRPVKAVLRGRTQVVRREVPFRFTDIPLPR